LPCLVFEIRISKHFRGCYEISAVHVLEVHTGGGFMLKRREQLMILT
jgi:hypothetical protein